MKPFRWPTRRALAVWWLYDRHEIEVLQDLETQIRVTIEATKAWIASTQDQTVIGRK